MITATVVVMGVVITIALSTIVAMFLSVLLPS